MPKTYRKSVLHLLMYICKSILKQLQYRFAVNFGTLSRSDRDPIADHGYSSGSGFSVNGHGSGYESTTPVSTTLPVEPLLVWEPLNGKSRGPSRP